MVRLYAYLEGRLAQQRIGITKLDPLLVQLASKDAVLLHQIRDRQSLLTIQLPGQDGEHPRSPKLGVATELHPPPATH